ncbi:MAG: HEAT repeat domain-containing protein [Candidatus Riflebacteria bacterium]|nr:HEAT repeat domain-containing protein [Candidatus Riflebacteria bacterium]
MIIIKKRFLCVSLLVISFSLFPSCIVSPLYCSETVSISPNDDLADAPADSDNESEAKHEISSSSVASAEAATSAIDDVSDHFADSEAIEEIEKKARKKKASILKSVKELLNPEKAKKAFDQYYSMGLEKLPAVTEMLKNKNLRLIRAGLDLSATLQEPSENLLKEMVRILVNKKFGNLRLKAAQMLGSWGKLKGDALPALLSVLGDSSSNLRSIAAEALVECYSKDLKSISGLKKMLSDKNSPLRKTAVAALQNYGTALHPALPLLIAFSEKKKLDAQDILPILLPKVISALAFKNQKTFSLLQEDEIGPDDEAIDDAIKAADSAAAADSFENIPADTSDKL